MHKNEEQMHKSEEQNELMRTDEAQRKRRKVSFSFEQTLLVMLHKIYNYQMTKDDKHDATMENVHLTNRKWKKNTIQK